MQVFADGVVCKGDCGEGQGEDGQGHGAEDETAAIERLTDRDAGMAHGGNQEYEAP